jgi:hypothetical protein
LKARGLEQEFKPLLLYAKDRRFSKKNFPLAEFSAINEKKRLENHFRVLCVFLFARFAAKNFLTAKRAKVFAKNAKV